MLFKNWKLGLWLMALSFVVLTLPSCRRGATQNDALTMVPAEASMVIAIQPQRLLDKADFASVQNMDFYKDAVRKATEQSVALGELLKNPAASGIDLQKPAYFFALPDFKDENGGKPTLNGLVFSLSDEQKFADFAQKANIGSVEKLTGALSLVAKDDNILAWQGKSAFVGNVLPAAQKTAVPALFEGGKKSIVKDAKAAKMIRSEHDISLWLSTNQLAENFKPDIRMSMLGITKEALKDNFITGFADFEKGVMKASSTFDLQKDLVKDFNLFFKDKPTTQFAPLLPADNVSSVAVMALDMKGINQVLKEKNLNGLINMQMGRIGLTSDDIARAIGGDLMISTIATPDQKAVDLLVGLSIDDKATIEKMLSLAVTSGTLEKSGDMYLAKGVDKLFSDAQKGMGSGVNPQATPARIYLTDKVLVFCSNGSIVTQIASGKGLGYQGEIATSLSQNIINLFFDYTKLKSVSPSFAGDHIRDYRATINRTQADATVHTTDANKNALKALIEQADASYKANKENRETTVSETVQTPPQKGH